MDQWAEIALHSAATSGGRSTSREASGEAAWEKLLSNYTPMLYKFTPPWLRGEDRDDWMGELRVCFVGAVKSFNPLAGVKFSSYLFSCLYYQYQQSMHRWYAKKRNPRNVGVSLNHHVNEDESSSELVDFLADTRSMNPEDAVALKEFLQGVAERLDSPREVSVWDSLVRQQGDVDGVVRELCARELKVSRKEVCKIRRKIRRMRSDYHAEDVLASVAVKSDPTCTFEPSF